MKCNSLIRADAMRKRREGWRGLDEDRVESSLLVATKLIKYLRLLR